LDPVFPTLSVIFSLKNILSFVDGRKKGTTEVKGMRKLINYQNKLTEYNNWRRRASPEDIEYQEIEIGELRK
jgi:hypothetical protein